MGHFIPSSLILSRTWLTKPRVVRLTAKGFNSGLLIIRDDQGYELMVQKVVDVSCSAASRNSRMRLSSTM
jgi:hypothetical protein